MSPNSHSEFQQMVLNFLGVVTGTLWLLFPLTFITALLLMLIIGRPMIDWLRARRWRKGAELDETWTVREDTPETHQVKQGTPSMGGIGIIAVATLSFLSVLATFTGLYYVVEPNSLSGMEWGWLAPVLLLPMMVAAHALLGFTDDWSKATGRGGLRARSKFILQVVLASLFVAAASVYIQIMPRAPEERMYDLILILVGALVLVIVGTCNAVNLTDGIDGLAAGLTIQVGVALLLTGIVEDIALCTGLFLIALTGACMGFLVFNKYPARVFMGDTGSLALGAALGAAGVLLHAVWLLPFIGFIFYIEAASVMLQVMWFKWTRKRTGQGKRLFRRAPLHHHFELGGWSEWRVVLTFWGVNLVTTIIGLVLWHTGVLPRWP